MERGEFSVRLTAPAAIIRFSTSLLGSALIVRSHRAYFTRI